MIIKLAPYSPLSPEESLSLVRAGDALAINGVRYDFSRLLDGSTLPAWAVGSEYVVVPIERIGGELSITLRLPNAPDAPESARFPVDIRDPEDGPVRLPGLELGERVDPTSGVIDWSQEITAEDKAQAAAEEHLESLKAELAGYRKIADDAIAPLQDAVDIDDATDEEKALLTLWKKYRVALNRLPDQEGYPSTISWPSPPA